ncbi:DUF3592 domain-containing protein [Corallococcus terminator]
MASRVGSSLVLLVFVLPWTALTGVADYFAISTMVRQTQAASWPSVQGTITRSEVESVRSNKSTTYGLKVAYDYSVDGQRHEGTRHRYASGRSGVRAYSEELVARYPLGASVPVYYRPGQPSEAVLQVGLDSTELFVLMGMLPFNLIALWLWAIMMSPSKPEPLVSPFRQEDGGEGVTLDAPSPIRWATLALGCSGLVCFALGGTLGGFTAPLPLGVGAWGVVIACGVFAGQKARARLKAGRYDLRLHTRARSLSLPPFSARKHRLDLRWRDVLALRIEPQLRKPKEKEVRGYRLTLELSTADGGGRQEAIAEFTRQEDAEALARWLRKHLKVEETAPDELRSA